MLLTKHALLITALILAGMLMQQILLKREQHQKKRLTVWRSLLLGYWILFALALFVGGIRLFIENLILMGVITIALGLGMLLSNGGVLINQEMLKYAGVFIGSLAPTVMGIYSFTLGQIVVGCISLALGIGIMLSSLNGWPASVGKFIMGTLIAASGLFMLSGMIPTGTAWWRTLLMGVMMVGMGAVPIWIGLGEMRRLATTT